MMNAVLFGAYQETLCLYFDSELATASLSFWNTHLITPFIHNRKGSPPRKQQHHHKGNLRILLNKLSQCIP